MIEVYCGRYKNPEKCNWYNGCTAYKIGLYRSAVKLKAQKTQYNRQYRVYEDGHVDYRCNRWTNGGILRSVGDEYYHDCETVGSMKDDTKKKFSLLKLWRKKLLPRLEQLANDINGIIWYQHDNAGAHDNVALVKFLEEEFERRGWIFIPQPPRSPLTNVNDLQLFPSLSKAISHHPKQWRHGKMYHMNKDDIWTAADDEFAKMPMELIAKAFITKWTHIVPLIHEENGRNSYVNDRKKLHSGVRCNFKTNGANGVERIDPTRWIKSNKRARNTLTKNLHSQ
jgi:hypothetical protein